MCTLCLRHEAHALILREIWGTGICASCPAPLVPLPFVAEDMALYFRGCDFVSWSYVSNCCCACIASYNVQSQSVVVFLHTPIGQRQCESDPRLTASPALCDSDHVLFAMMNCELHKALSIRSQNSVEVLLAQVRSQESGWRNNASQES